MRSLPCSALLAALAAVAVPRAQIVSTVVAGNVTTTVTCQANWRRNVAVAPNGFLWTLVREVDPTDQRLELYASSDGGASWFHFPNSGTTTVEDGNGSIAFGVDCSLLHVVWNAKDGSGIHDVYYQTFDTATGQWSGLPLKLTSGTSSNDQYYANDVEITPKGTVVVVLSTHRAPPSSVWLGGWATGIRVKPRGGVFSPVAQVNTDTYGQRPDAQAIGETVHFAFRTNTGLYGTRWRAFDTETMQFTTSTDVQVEPGTSNVSCIAADESGGLYVLYNTGGTSAGSGEIRVAYAAPGMAGTWSLETVAADSDLIKGNVAYTHYSLATLEGDLVAVFYSKRTVEQHRTLYYRLMQGGMFVSLEVPIVTSMDPDRFALVCGLRNTQSTTTAIAITESRAVAHVGRRVEFVALGAAGQSVRLGLGCAGTLPSAPRISIGNVPTAGGALVVEVDDAPANQQGAVFISFSCLGAPLPLDGLGMPGCTLGQLPALSFTYGTDGSGSYSIGLPIPAGTTLVRTPITFQTLVIAPSANPFQALTSDQAMAWLP